MSLPRAGSTLLQRLLVRNFQVESPAEPWILLPLLWERTKGPMVTGYWGRAGRKAIDQYFEAAQPGCEQAATRAYYHAAINLPKFAEEGRCFIDKTPRYLAVGGKLAATFPEGRFIMLWRSPVDVALSIMRTWERMRPLFHSYRVDFSLGTKGYADAFEQAGEAAVQITYKHLCEEPVQALETLRNDLGLRPSQPELTADLGPRITGFGDPTGQGRWETVQSKSGKKPEEQLRLSGFSKRALISLLRLVDPRYFALGGTNLEAEISRVRAMPTGVRRWWADLCWVTFAQLELALQLRAMLRRRDNHPRLLLS